MGLMLSVLIVCVGVIEALSCFEHFQYGVIHCATNVYEHARRRSSVFLKYTSRRLKLLSDDSMPEEPENVQFVEENFYGHEEPELAQLNSVKPINKKKLEKEDKIQIVKTLMEKPARPKTVRSISMPEFIYTERDIQLSEIINNLAIEPIEEVNIEIEDVNTEVLTEEFDKLFDEYENSHDYDIVDDLKRAEGAIPESVGDKCGEKIQKKVAVEINSERRMSLGNGETTHPKKVIKPPQVGEKGSHFDRFTSADFDAVTTVKSNKSKSVDLDVFYKFAHDSFGAGETLPIQDESNNKLNDAIFENETPPTDEVIDKTFEEIYNDIFEESLNEYEDIEKTILSEFEWNTLENSDDNQVVCVANEADIRLPREEILSDNCGIGGEIPDPVFLKAVEQLAELIVKDCLNLGRMRNLILENLNNNGGDDINDFNNNSSRNYNSISPENSSSNFSSSANNNSNNSEVSFAPAKNHFGSKTIIPNGNIPHAVVENVTIEPKSKEPQEHATLTDLGGKRTNTSAMKESLPDVDTTQASTVAEGKDIPTPSVYNNIDVKEEESSTNLIRKKPQERPPDADLRENLKNMSSANESLLDDGTIQTPDSLVKGKDIPTPSVYNNFDVKGEESSTNLIRKEPQERPPDADLRGNLKNMSSANESLLDDGTIQTPNSLVEGKDIPIPSVVNKSDVKEVESNAAIVKPESCNVSIATAGVSGVINTVGNIEAVAKDLVSLPVGESDVESPLKEKKQQRAEETDIRIIDEVEEKKKAESIPAKFDNEEVEVQPEIAKSLETQEQKVENKSGDKTEVISTEHKTHQHHVGVEKPLALIEKIEEQVKPPPEKSQLEFRSQENNYANLNQSSGNEESPLSKSESLLSPEYKEGIKLEEEAISGEHKTEKDIKDTKVENLGEPPSENSNALVLNYAKETESDSPNLEKNPKNSDCKLEHSPHSEKQVKATNSAAEEAFWLIFSGEYTKAMSKDWHSGHFSCWQCDEALTGQRYVLRDDHPYCIKCYESVFANVCEECNKIIGIDSKDLSYKDKHWHEACFLCNKCRVSLVDKQFGSKADKIYCGNCYDAQFASRCDGCGEIFRAGTKKMEYKTRQWHEKCFCCCVCKTPIGTKSFIPREQEIYCATCYEEKFATRCVKCNKIITSGGVTYKNEPWHRECFTCTNCNTSLAGQRFTSRDEKPYCADCFGELFAKRCTACSRPITGIGGTRFISFEDRHWHNDCFICASCKTSLVGRGFITDGDDIICPECAKQKLM